MTASFRRMIPVDLDFVISGWSSSYRNSKTAGLISMDRWANVMHAEIRHLIDTGRADVTVCYEPGQFVESVRGPRPFHYGFVAMGPRVATRRGSLPYVLYVYVKSAYRQGRQRLELERGYASQLLEHVGVDPRAPFVYACSTGVVSDLARKIPLSEYNPLPIRYQEPHEQRTSSNQDRAARQGHPE